MAYPTLARRRAVLLRHPEHRGYWASVFERLRRDRIALFGLGLLIFMATITLAAPWLAANVFGFDPVTTNLRMRNEPPTWAEEAWPQFKAFTNTCRRRGCDWGMWGSILVASAQGLGRCLTSAPGECHWMGTDEAGRDVLVRGLYGGRVSLRIGLVVAAVALTVGVALGLLSGYYAATRVDDVIYALILLFESVPLLFLLIILSRIVEPGPEGLALLLGLFGWITLTRVLRGQIFALRERDFVLASYAVGASSWRIMFRQILPNVTSMIIVFAVFEVAAAILAEAALSYLGVGIGPPHPSWGNMMQGSLGNFTDAPWLVMAPGAFIFVTTLGIYLFGDGLRDALDPMLARTK